MSTTVHRRPRRGLFDTLLLACLGYAVYAATQEYGGVHTKSPGFMALWVRYIGYAEVKARGMVWIWWFENLN